MNYETAKKLKDAGFPQKTRDILYDEEDGSDIANPSLSELIEACGEHFYQLIKEVDGINWSAHFYDIEDSTRQVNGKGQTPEIAVANLWLALNQK